MAQSNVVVNKSYADAAALQAWLSNLATDVNAGKILTFAINTIPGTSGGVVQGSFALSAATAISDLTVAVED
jgi:V8-like Glu-specific endopeptidase